MIINTVYLKNQYRPTFHKNIMKRPCNVVHKDHYTKYYPQEELLSTNFMAKYTYNISSLYYKRKHYPYNENE